MLHDCYNIEAAAQQMRLSQENYKELQRDSDFASVIRLGKRHFTSPSRVAIIRQPKNPATGRRVRLIQTPAADSGPITRGAHAAVGRPCRLFVNFRLQTL